ncbi:MAG: uncharacterized protein QOI75_3720 [Pseudonocardiales bacterium]|nr:uncharacterized protein [Pseudonocardiales bacterium]
MLEVVGLLLAGVVAGALNAVGGGGTFVALPALVVAGMPPVTANASTTVALLPGTLASAWTFRREITTVGTTSKRSLTAMSLVGGLIGAGLLLTLPAVSFAVAVPWLLAFATVVLAFGRRLTRLLGEALQRPLALSSRAVLVGQFVLAIYGGYFGGAVGILMLALWSVGLGLDTAVGNPMRVAQIATIYTVATVLFLIAADVLGDPIPLLAVLLGALAGGLGGAHLARRLPSWLLRGVVLTIAVTMTVLYFLRG